MRAIILAAGRGLRLKQPEDEQVPKCLLRFGGMSLLERHLRMLKTAGVTEIVLALGFRHELVEAELDRLQWKPRPEIVINPQFELGSVLTVHTIADAMARGGDVLLMDADVLYDERIMRALVADAAPVNRLLIDREFEPGDEPVKICVKDGVPIELRKQPDANLQYDTIGESVGFFRFDQTLAQSTDSFDLGFGSRNDLLRVDVASVVVGLRFWRRPAKRARNRTIRARLPRERDSSPSTAARCTADRYRSTERSPQALPAVRQGCHHVRCVRRSAPAFAFLRLRWIASLSVRLSFSFVEGGRLLPCLSS